MTKLGNVLNIFLFNGACHEVVPGKYFTIDTIPFPPITICFPMTKLCSILKTFLSKGDCCVYAPGNILEQIKCCFCFMVYVYSLINLPPLDRPQVTLSSI